MASNRFRESGLKAHEYLSGPITSLTDAYLQLQSGQAKPDNAEIGSVILEASSAISDIFHGVMTPPGTGNLHHTIDLTASLVMSIMQSRYMEFGYDPAHHARGIEADTATIINGALEYAGLSTRVKWGPGGFQIG